MILVVTMIKWNYKIVCWSFFYICTDFFMLIPFFFMFILLVLHVFFSPVASLLAFKTYYRTLITRGMIQVGGNISQ